MWESAKWLSATCFLVATVMMMSPKMAAVSTIPWILFLIGNGIWTADCVRQDNKPYFTLGLIFSACDVLIISLRALEYDITPLVQPMLDYMETII